jgi:hypothetical protein|eukprot:COSAG06_NODE_1140_length_10558_cov_34.662492_13_plen_123_part_00
MILHDSDIASALLSRRRARCSHRLIKPSKSAYMLTRYSSTIRSANSAISSLRAQPHSGQPRSGRTLVKRAEISFLYALLWRWQPASLRMDALLVVSHRAEDLAVLVVLHLQVIQRGLDTVAA